MQEHSTKNMQFKMLCFWSRQSHVLLLLFFSRPLNLALSLPQRMLSFSILNKCNHRFIRNMRTQPTDVTMCSIKSTSIRTTFILYIKWCKITATSSNNLMDHSYSAWYFRMHRKNLLGLCFYILCWPFHRNSVRWVLIRVRVKEHKIVVHSYSIQ